MRSPQAHLNRWGWAAVGMALVAIHAALLGISDAFRYGRPILERPVGLLVGLLVTAGLIYLFAAFRLRRPAQGGSGCWWAWMLGVGLLLRILMLPATPILEDDYYRYLWDGGVVAHGHDPYAHAPEAVRNGDVPAPVLELAASSGPAIERINHPHLRTIYPSIAQGAFALAHWVAPWRIEGLRLVWFLFDAATLVLLVGLLGELGLSASAVLIYWWNPLLIMQVDNAGHMELAILPFLVGALWLAVRGRSLLSGGALGLAAGAKLWPVVLLPALARQRGLSWRRQLGMGVVLGATAGLLAAPLLLSAAGDASGLRAYASYWQMNDTLYQLLYTATGWLTPRHPHQVARLITATLLLGWVAWLCRRPAANGRAVCERALWTLAALFLLSPTQFPWYWLWMLPLLAIHPSPGLLVLTATLPLYYLRFTMNALGYVSWFDHGVVWLEFAPAFALLGWEAWRSRPARLPRDVESRPAV